MSSILEPRSQTVVNFGEELRHRLLGNAEDQRVLPIRPDRLLNFGIIFSETDARLARSGIRSVFKPNSCTVRFEVNSQDFTHLELQITPSFWLYFERQDQPDSIAGERWEESEIFRSWRGRSVSSNSATSPLLDGERRYVRSRFAERVSVKPVLGVTIEYSLDSDLQEFRQSRLSLGRAPEWRGLIRVDAKNKVSIDTNPPRVEITVQLINKYERRRVGEPAWFDVRMQIETNTAVEPVYCPLLDRHQIFAQTTNCTLSESSTFPQSDSARIQVEQISLVKRMRQRMKIIVGLAFANASTERLLESALTFATEASIEHQQALNQAIDRIRRDPNATAALDIVVETLRRASKDPSWSWYRHQAAILILSAARYLDGSQTLNPLVVNVPTAGGKTEAFTAAALWTVAYERLAHNRLGVAIVKYPTTFLSADQSRRFASLVMHFDNVMSERLGRKDDRGLGLFFGPDRTATRQDAITLLGARCPMCGASWQATREAGRSRLTCTENASHSMIVAVRDEIFPRPPSLIAATIDKFVSKARKNDIACLFGAPLYWCPHESEFTSRRQCWDNATRRLLSNSPATEQPILTTLILDEAHLLREETGSLDSHFETHYFEMARQLGGRYPLVIISTATIAQIGEHTRQLGLSTPNIFPGDQNRIYYQTSENEIQHVVLGGAPRGRAIAHALPWLFGDYLRVEESNLTSFRPAGLRPPLIYRNSYATRDQVVNTLRQQIAPPRREIGLSLEIEEFSRRRFDEKGVREILTKLENGNLDGIVTTNIASVGVDLGQLNGMIYFGMPSNVAEFVQSLNRVGRQSPAISCLVFNPGLERDMAFYSYLEPFLKYSDRLVEAVPLNRWARRAIDYTFDVITLSQIQHIWVSRVPNPDRVNLLHVQERWGVKGFREARGRELNETSVVSLLQSTYRSSDDPSRFYADRIGRLWQAFATNISNFRPTFQKKPGQSYDDNFIWNTPQINPMYQLRSPEKQGELRMSGAADRLIEAGIRAIFASDADVQENLRDEEIDLGTVDAPNPPEGNL